LYIKSYEDCDINKSHPDQGTGTFFLLCDCWQQKVASKAAGVMIAEALVMWMHLTTNIQDYIIRSKAKHYLIVIFYSLALYLG
jgi:hypothetical protein